MINKNQAEIIKHFFRTGMFATDERDQDGIDAEALVSMGIARKQKGAKWIGGGETFYFFDGKAMRALTEYERQNND